MLREGSKNEVPSIDLSIDARQADIIFPGGEGVGPVRVQLIPQLANLTEIFDGRYTPLWRYEVYPSGIRIDGSVKLNLGVPEYRGSYNYIPQKGKLVVILGRDDNSLKMVPVGVGRLEEGPTVQSVGGLHFSSLDYIAFAAVSDDMQPMLALYVNGEIGIDELRMRLQTAELH